MNPKQREDILNKFYLVYSMWPNKEGIDLVGVFRSREKAVLFKEDYRESGFYKNEIFISECCTDIVDYLEGK